MADEPRPAASAGASTLAQGAPGRAPGRALPAGAVPEGPNEWTKRPAFHPEEGEADKSDWMAFAKSIGLIVGVLAVIAFLLSR
ncbi:hypothetical protein BKE38_04415 [Pseudoroseomonas deserti]|uniref:Uncharacterized protein n=1 Tax=Teichococcus deserti TaxID=1817963 RepID=A0A1V2H6C2_9PROT|nr:hypothetical protein [Pseudoroseomonas deserti]ONG57297.1 hypothetical protein BKE38_04415 [Pseudoroseomonas deserti]